MHYSICNISTLFYLAFSEGSAFHLVNRVSCTMCRLLSNPLHHSHYTIILLIRQQMSGHAMACLIDSHMFGLHIPKQSLSKGELYTTVHKGRAGWNISLNETRNLNQRNVLLCVLAGNLWPCALLGTQSDLYSLEKKESVSGWIECREKEKERER